MRSAKWWGKRPGLFVSNSRFYILLSVVVISLAIVCYFRISIISDQLFLIRTQQVFGFAALAMWYLALLATPLSTIFGKQGIMQQYLYARRALGVSAAYFALLHMLFGVFGQLGGPGNILSLPERFQQALLLGLVGLVVLGLMAATSFDRVIKWMTFPRWKWLHRLGYLAAVSVLIHMWIIGTHLESNIFRWAIYLPIALLALLESWRMAKIFEKSAGLSDAKMIWLIFISLALMIAGTAAYLPSTISRYHDNHQDGAGHR